MSNEKLREALPERDAIASTFMRNTKIDKHTARKLADLTLAYITKALATTEPEPTGMPELPEPHAVITGKLGTHCSFNSSELRKGDPIYTAGQMRAAMAQGVKG